MKFIVTKDVNVTEVKLHWETKDKIKRFLYLTSGAVITIGTVVWIMDEKHKDIEEQK